MLEQECHDLPIALIGSHVQRGFAVRRLCVHVCSFFQEECHHVSMACRYRDVKRCGTIGRRLVDQRTLGE